MNKTIILLLTATALMLALPVSSQTTNELEDTPGTHEYFIKYIDGRRAFTNNQMVRVRSSISPINGRIVQKIEKGKYIIKMREENLFGRTIETTAILLADDDKYRERQAIAAWALNMGEFTCTDDKGNFSTLTGYRIPIPNAITFQQYQKLFKEGVLTPNRILTIYPKISKQQAAAYQKEAWELSTSTNKTILNGEKAITLAIKALAHSPGSWSYLDTLAAAYARNGSFKKAIETQKKAIEIHQKAAERSLNVIGRRLPKNLDTQDALQSKLALYKNNQPYTQQPKVTRVSSYAERLQKRREQMHKRAEDKPEPTTYVRPLSKQEIADKKATEELTKLSPSELRKHVATLKDEYKAAYNAFMVKVREQDKAKKQLETAEEPEMDKAAIAYYHAKSQYQLAKEKRHTTRRASEFALNFYVNSLTNSNSTIEINTPKKTTK